MGGPQPARAWPDRPLTPGEAEAVYDRTEARAVWVLDYDDSARVRLVPDDTPHEAVVDVVLERDTEIRVYAYSAGRWLDSGWRETAAVHEVTAAESLSPYRVLAGYSDVL